MVLTVAFVGSNNRRHRIVIVKTNDVVMTKGVVELRMIYGCVEYNGSSSLLMDEVDHFDGRGTE